MRGHPLYHALSQRGLNPIKLAYDPCRQKPAPSNQHLKHHYASSPGYRDYCCAELPASQMVAVAITSTHCAYPQRDGLIELASVAGLNT